MAPKETIMALWCAALAVLLLLPIICAPVMQ